MQQNLSVGGGLADCTVLNERAAQREAIGEVAIVRDGKAAGVDFGKKRLNIAQNCAARGGVAHMANGYGAWKAGDGCRRRKMISNQAVAPLGAETLPVKGDNAGGFLPAMLQGVEA